MSERVSDFKCFSNYRHNRFILAARSLLRSFVSSFVRFITGRWHLSDLNQRMKVDRNPDDMRCSIFDVIYLHAVNGLLSSLRCSSSIRRSSSPFRSVHWLKKPRFLRRSFKK